MFIKNQSVWERYITYEDTDTFKILLDNLKSYSKSFNSSTYSITSTLNDVYENMKFQHSLWMRLTSISTDSIEIFGNTYLKNEIYNLLKDVNIDDILASSILRNYISIGYIEIYTIK